jgi:Ca2+-binding RTX toxin-like protein
MTLFVTLSTSNVQSGDGYDYTSDQETVTILANVFIGSIGAEGVMSTFNDSGLINRGSIFSGADTGVTMAGTNASVFNDKTGTITGIDEGVTFAGNGTEIFTNWGTILAGGGAGVHFLNRPAHSPQTVSFSNHGKVSGSSGVVIDSDSTGGVFQNYGTIFGSVVGFFIRTASGLTTDITNAAGATIEGLRAAITQSTGDFHLVNHGTIIGAIDNRNGDDTIINRGKIAGVVALGTGDSLFDGRGGTSGAILAGDGDNRIIDGNGTVVVHVGTGDNTITGGPGTDRFIFESALTGQVDRITNFTPGVDKIVLSQTDFAGIGPVGHALAAADFRFGAHPTTASQHILYDPATGFLYYDPDGNGPQARMHFATLSSHLPVGHADFLVVA